MSRPIKTKNPKMTSIVFGDDDRKKIAAIREKFGLKTDSDAIRMALGIAVNSKIVLSDTNASQETHEAE